MITKLEQLDLNAKFSYADYLVWSFQERIELIRGKIFQMSPAPSMRHQRVSANLIVQMANWFKTHDCRLFHAPFDVRLSDERKKGKKRDEDILTVVQPDICVICDENKLDEKGCNGAPDWVIEILSPGSQKIDLKLKYRLYEENGVREYWIIHPFENYIQAYTLLPNGKFGNYRIFTDEDETQHVSPDIFPDLTLHLPEIFE